MVQTAAQPKKRKAGGNGKKGKTFMEDKSALLSLIDALPKVQKESAAEDALSAKGKSKSAAGEDEPVYAAGRAIDAAELDRPEKASGGKGKGKSTDEATKQSKNRQRTKAKNRALLDTKRAIIAETKEVKKQRKEAKKPVSQRLPKDGEAGPDSKLKRRVGFAV